MGMNVHEPRSWLPRGIDPFLIDSHSLSLSWHLRFCILNNLPGDANVPVHISHFVSIFLDQRFQILMSA